MSTRIPDSAERALPEFNAMQRVKRRFFAMRNGDLAAQMRCGGLEYQINFGLLLPQISEIARDFLPGGAEYQGEDFDMADFALRLRDNRSTRESMLIAPMLFPVEQLSVLDAVAWAVNAPTCEVADILCMKLLRNHPHATEIAAYLLGHESEMGRYSGFRLTLNLLSTGRMTPLDATTLTADAMKNPGNLARGVARQLAGEIEFLMED